MPNFAKITPAKTAPNHKPNPSRRADIKKWYFGWSAGVFGRNSKYESSEFGGKVKNYEKLNKTCIYKSLVIKDGLVNEAVGGERPQVGVE